jgi:Xaa-Pro aminopeptidase
MKPIYPDIGEAEYRSRISKIQKTMKERDLDAILISSGVNSYYFTGFDNLQLYAPEDDVTRALIIRRDEDPVWITSQGFGRSFEACAWPAEIRPYGRDQASGFMEIWNELGLKGAKVGAELGLGSNRVDLPGQIFLDLAKACSFVDASDLIDSVRLIKSQEELKRVRTAAEISERAFQRLIPEIKVGMTERKIASLLGTHLLEEGADRPYYVLVRAAERYRNRLFCVLPIDKKINKGDYVKIEYSADYRHYVNEAKSLVLMGTQPEPSERDHYQLNVEAIRAGAKAAKSGAPVADVARAARAVFEEAGLKVNEGMSFGHGTGMNGHEPPVVGPNDKTRLQAGMVFVIEPGHIPDAEGLNREISCGNTVIVKTSGAAERLPPLSEEIISI